MRLFRTILMALFLAGSLLPGLGAEPILVNPATGAAAQPEAALREEHGMSPDALGLGPTGGSFVTSSMVVTWAVALGLDRKSTRLNSSHLGISYAVFCL